MAKTRSGGHINKITNAQTGQDMEETNTRAQDNGGGPSSDPFRALQEHLNALQAQNELMKQRN
jgi:hypothetical protein